MPSASDSSRYQACVLFSLLLHGAALAVSLLLFSNLRLAGQPEPFRWNVGVVEPREAAASGTTAAAATPPAQALPESHPPRAAVTKAGLSRSAPIAALQPTARPEHGTEGRQSTASPQMKPESRSADLYRADHAPVEEGQHIASPPEVPPPSHGAVSAHPTDVDAQGDLPAKADEREASLSPEPRESADPRAVEERTPSVAQQESAVPASVPEEPHVGRHPTEIASLGSSGPHQDRDGEATTPPSAQRARQDLAWLGEALRNRLQQSHKYSTVARLNGLEGRVVLRITVRENGELLVALGKSSGHEVLDRDAVEAVQRLSPLTLHHPLGRTQQSLNLPITYTLDR